MALTQCAWCNRFYDRSGFLTPTSPPPGVGINHGICYICLDGMLASEIARLAALGDHVAAREMRHRRRETADRLARQRHEARRAERGSAARVCQILVAYSREVLVSARWRDAVASNTGTPEA